MEAEKVGRVEMVEEDIVASEENVEAMRILNNMDAMEENVKEKRLEEKMYETMAEEIVAEIVKDIIVE